MIELVKKIMFRNDKFPITKEVILETLRKNPDLIKINKENIPNEGYILNH